MRVMGITEVNVNEQPYPHRAQNADLLRGGNGATLQSFEECLSMHVKNVEPISSIQKEGLMADGLNRGLIVPLRITNRTDQKPKEE